MRKNKLLIVALILGTVCMLCGCAPDVSIDIECDGLEEGESVFVLTRPTDDEELKVPEENELPENFMNGFMEYSYQELLNCKRNFRDIKDIVLRRV